MAKMNKKEMMENMLTMPDILKEFHSYKTGKQKAAFLREMGTLNLPHAVNWENLAQAHEGSRKWPAKKTNKEDDTILKDYLDPVGETEAEKVLTMQEVDAIL